MLRELWVVGKNYERRESLRIVRRFRLPNCKESVVEKHRGVLEGGNVLGLSSPDFESPALCLTRLEAFVRLSILSKYQFP